MCPTLPLSPLIHACDLFTLNALLQVGQTPLHKAAKSGKAEAAEVLIVAGATVDAKSIVSFSSCSCGVVLLGKLLLKSVLC